MDQGRAQRAKRIKIFQPATLTIEGVSARVHLLDLSAAGARAHAAVPPPCHAEVRVECDGVTRTARVRWRDGARFGLQFDAPLTAEQVDRLTPSIAVPA